MARVVGASVVTKRLRERGWQPVTARQGELRFRKADSQIQIPLHPRQLESVYLADVVLRLPKCRAELAAEAIEEPLGEIAGFEILVDQGETTPQDVQALLDALDALHRAEGGDGLLFASTETPHRPQTGTTNAAPNIRMIRGRPRAEGTTDRETARNAWRSTVACLTRRALRTIERRRRGYLEAMLETIDLQASPRTQKSIEEALKAIGAAERTIRDKRGLLRYPSGPFLRELETGPAVGPRDPALRERACRELKEADRLPSISSGVFNVVEAAAAVLAGRLDPVSLARAVERDPAIAARIVHRATRADIPIQRSAKNRMTIAQATLLLGAQKVRAMALGGELVSRYGTGSCTAFDYELFWQECTARGTAARVVTAASGRKDISDDEAYTAGLFCQVGRLAFATAFPQEYAQMLEDAGDSPGRLLALEFDCFRVDHNEVAAEMMAEWRMPDLKEAVLHQDNPGFLGKTREGTLARILEWSGMIWEIIRRGREPVDRGVIETTVERALDLGVGSWAFAEEFDRIRETWSVDAELLQVGAVPVEPWERILETAA